VEEWTLEILVCVQYRWTKRGETMKRQMKDNIARRLLTLLFSSLIPLILLWALTKEIAEPRVSSATTLKGRNHSSLLDAQPGVSVCEQTQNLVPNPGFEQGTTWPNYWYGGGDCIFTYEPGHDSAKSTRIFAGSARDHKCVLFTPINEVSVMSDKFYDYSAWVKTDLLEGAAKLCVTFWSQQGDPPVWNYEGEGCTTSVADTQGAWAKVTGSSRVPANAEYARVQATLAKSGVGSAWFDDVFFGLSICLDISKSAAPDPVAPGDILTYTIVYSNTGRQRATDEDHVRVIETYDSHVDFVYTRTQPPPDVSTNIWEIPELLPDSSDMITVVVEVRDDAPAWLLNRVEIHSDVTVEPVATTISSRVYTHTETPAVTIDPPEQSGVGEPGWPTKYNLDLRNVGSCDGQVGLVITSSFGSTATITPSLPYTLLSGESMPVTVSVLIPQHVPYGAVDVTSITATLECEHTEPARDAAILTTSVQSRVLLTLVTKNFGDTGYFEGPWECEPNNTYVQANGPLRAGRVYYGYPNDQWDIFSIEPSAHGQIVADLAIQTGSGVQLQLRDQGGGLLTYDYQELYHVEYIGPKGRYYICIYTEAGHKSDKPYTLLAMFP
jgi:uncharacterized repeat protein (TIGR01451 family)